MRNITLSAQADLIDKARAVAERQHRSLNDLFRDWLTTLTQSLSENQSAQQRLHTLWDNAHYFQLDHKPTRDEMNER